MDSIAAFDTVNPALQMRHGIVSCAMRASILGFLLTAVSACSAWAITIENQSFSPEYTGGTNRLVLNNAGLLKVGMVFKVYAAALYLETPEHATRVLEDVPKRLEIAYLRNIPRQELIKAAEQHLSAHFKTAEIDAIRDRLDRINALYSDVRPGDRYALTYQPGTGCVLERNGQVLGRAEGYDFARIYFDIWLGKNCSQPAFRDLLLKRPGPT